MFRNRVDSCRTIPPRSVLRNGVPKNRGDVHHPSACHDSGRDPGFPLHHLRPGTVTPLFWAAEGASDVVGTRELPNVPRPRSALTNARPGRSWRKCVVVAKLGRGRGGNRSFLSEVSSLFILPPRLPKSAFSQLRLSPGLRKVLFATALGTVALALAAHQLKRRRRRKKLAAPEKASAKPAGVPVPILPTRRVPSVKKGVYRSN